MWVGAWAGVGGRMCACVCVGGCKWVCTRMCVCMCVYACARVYREGWAHEGPSCPLMSGVGSSSEQKNITKAKAGVGKVKACKK